jgi:uncharacterized membrane protein
MAIEYKQGKQTASAARRLMVAATIGAIALLASGISVGWYIAPLIAWDVFALIYVLWVWATIMRLADADTGDFAKREDPSRFVTDSVLTIASLASLAAVASVLLQSANSGSATHHWQVGLGVASVIVSWSLVHTIYMLRYAELFYGDPAGGIDFGDTKHPTFNDFAYVAFTMGMTFQVSDTGLKSTAFRSLALRHALLSYVFGTVIVATTINLVAGLSN